MAGASSSNSSLLLPLPKITAGSDRSTAVPTRAIELVRRSKREKKRLAFLVWVVSTLENAWLPRQAQASDRETMWVVNAWRRWRCRVQTAGW